MIEEDKPMQEWGSAQKGLSKGGGCVGPHHWEQGQ